MKPVNNRQFFLTASLLLALAANTSWDQVGLVKVAVSTPTVVSLSLSSVRDPAATEKPAAAKPAAKAKKSKSAQTNKQAQELAAKIKELEAREAKLKAQEDAAKKADEQRAAAQANPSENNISICGHDGKVVLKQGEKNTQFTLDVSTCANGTCTPKTIGGSFDQRVEAITTSVKEAVQASVAKDPRFQEFCKNELKVNVAAQDKPVEKKEELNLSCKFDQDLPGTKRKLDATERLKCLSASLETATDKKGNRKDEEIRGILFTIARNAKEAMRECVKQAIGTEAGDADREKLKDCRDEADSFKDSFEVACSDDSTKCTKAAKEITAYTHGINFEQQSLQGQLDLNSMSQRFEQAKAQVENAQLAYQTFPNFTNSTRLMQAQWNLSNLSNRLGLSANQTYTKVANAYSNFLTKDASILPTTDSAQFKADYDAFTAYYKGLPYAGDIRMADDVAQGSINNSGVQLTPQQAADVWSARSHNQRSGNYGNLGTSLPSISTPSSVINNNGGQRSFVSPTSSSWTPNTSFASNQFSNVGRAFGQTNFATGNTVSNFGNTGTCNNNGNAFRFGNGLTAGCTLTGSSMNIGNNFLNNRFLTTGASTSLPTGSRAFGGSGS